MTDKQVEGQFGTYRGKLLDGKHAEYTCEVTFGSSGPGVVCFTVGRFCDDPRSRIAEEEPIAAAILAKIGELKEVISEHYLPHLQSVDDRFETPRELCQALYGGSLRFFDNVHHGRMRDLSFQVRGTADIERMQHGYWEIPDDEGDEETGFSIAVYLSETGEIVAWEQ